MFFYINSIRFLYLSDMLLYVYNILYNFDDGFLYFYDRFLYEIVVLLLVNINDMFIYYNERILYLQIDVVFMEVIDYVIVLVFFEEENCEQCYVYFIRVFLCYVILIFQVVKCGVLQQMICDKDVLVCGFFSYVIVVRCLDIVCKI